MCLCLLCMLIYWTVLYGAFSVIFFAYSVSFFCFCFIELMSLWICMHWSVTSLVHLLQTSSGLYMSLHPCYCTSCFGESDSVTFTFMVICSISYYCAVHPWSTIISALIWSAISHIYVIIGLKAFVHSSFDKHYACFFLSIILLALRWWQSILYAEVLPKVFKFLWHKVHVCIWHYLAGQLILWKDNLTCLYYVICAEPLYSFYHWELAAVIYNKMKVLDITGFNISSDRFPWHPWYYGWYCFVLCFAWKLKHLGQFFTISTMSAFMFIQ